MKLNLFQILEQLFIDYEVLHYSDPKSFDIQRVSCWENDGRVCADNELFIVSEESVVDLVDKNVHIICICPNIPRINYRSSKSFTRVSAGDSQKLRESIQSIIDEFRNWKMEIQDSILCGRPMQQTFDLCARFLNNPVGLFDSQQTFLMKAGTFESKTEGDLWDFVFQHGHSPVESESSEISDMLGRSELPFYYTTQNRYRNIQRLITPIRRNGALFGCLGSSNTNAPFTDGEFANMCMIQSFVETALLHTTEFSSASGDTPWFIRQLLRNNSVNPNVLSFNFARYGVGLSQKFILWNYNFEKVTENNNIEAVVSNISYFLQTPMVFPYANQIIAIDTQIDRQWDDRLTQALSNVLITYGVRCGRSAVFSSFIDLHHAFMQTVIALDHSSDQIITDFKDIVIPHIIQCVKNSPEAEGMVYPGLNKIKNYNGVYGLELLQCLRAYILSGRNVSATAKALFIHRHTLLYRLECIQSILPIDFDSLSENEMILLYFSCCALLQE